MPDSRYSCYSALARALHWASALVILWALLSGLFAAAWAGPTLGLWISQFNVAVTTLFVPIFLLRLGHRLCNRPPPAAIPPRERIAARIVHALLYLLIAIVLVSGVLMMDADIRVFDWFSLRRPVESPVINRLATNVHVIANALLALLIGLHVAAVIRHERRGRRVLRRMAWSPRRRQDPEFQPPVFR